MNSQSLWIKRHNLVQHYRSVMWDELSEPDMKEEWVNARPKPYQWSIDEILRHMLASEIRYVQQSIDESIPQNPHAVRAQWVGKVFFRTEETEHVGLSELKESFPPVESASLSLLENLSEIDFDMMVEAPWREKMPFYHLLERFHAHEHYHRGQVHFLITNYRGPPVFANVD